jgi:hypothetical protein
MLIFIGYFIPFITSMLTFIVFILPSKFDKNEFHKSVQQFQMTIERHLYLRDYKQ